MFNFIYDQILNKDLYVCWQKSVELKIVVAEPLTVGPGTVFAFKATSASPCFHTALPEMIRFIHFTRTPLKAVFLLTLNLKFTLQG